MYPVEIDIQRTQRFKLQIEVPSSLVPGEEWLTEFPDEEARILDLVTSVYTDAELIEMASQSLGTTDDVFKVIDVRSAPYGRPTHRIDVPALQSWQV